ncbi:Uncharacterized protein BP5553_04911 [Venustampulla echinocandica]|uniref:Uncharacterized protein n=1 Tax=Venustampulla echinocandica TaxID=2656787 RepID=A0A370TPN6_9HELO|nr:Uncharacterized protein BP5553_04911 [Venustampulla echinocandica]RDL37478.1 Uncharacterized protein BP5553_04911 [Venustampulla echinocandica]
MASLLRAIHDCLFGTDYNEVNISSEENVIAADILRTLFSADQGGKHLKKSVQEIVGERGWTENIAKAILGGIENGLKQGVQVGMAMKEASEKAIAEAADFAHDHPYFCALIAIGILAILMPWVLEVLGFAELGPVEGSFAAWWQSTYRGYVTQKSLFSFFQRLGMVWRRSVVKASL